MDQYLCLAMAQDTRFSVEYLCLVGSRTKHYTNRMDMGLADTKDAGDPSQTLLCPDEGAQKI